MKGKTSTLRGIARAIVRGVRANFSPENQQTEIERISELFQDMAMARDAETDNLKTWDVTVLDAIAANIDEEWSTSEKTEPLKWYVSSLSTCVVVIAADAADAAAKGREALRVIGSLSDVRMVRLATSEDVALHGVSNG